MELLADTENAMQRGKTNASHFNSSVGMRRTSKAGIVGRIACSSKDQPYVVPISFSYESPSHIYIFSTFGKKIEWMRRNPKVCLEVDEIANRSN